MTNIINCITSDEIPKNISLTNIMLPNSWILYLYDKSSFTKIANRANFCAKPYHEICEINTVADVIYIIQLMEHQTDVNSPKMNLDQNNYIIMRKGIQPLWEDPKNSNGGTFTINIDHSKGFNLWMNLFICMVGETFCAEMDNINGMTVSYIPKNQDHNSTTTGNESTRHESKSDGSIIGSTYIKIWDGKAGRTDSDFIKILPAGIKKMIQGESLRYTQNNSRQHYGNGDIISRIKNTKYNKKPYGYGGYRSGKLY